METARGQPQVDGRRVSEAEYLELAERLTRLDLIYKHNPALWLRHQARTVDEASGGIRPWMDEPVIDEVVHALRTERLLLIPKSRRRFITWTVSAFWVWDARYHDHHLNLIQSLSEEKAGFVVQDRCQFIEDNLASPMIRRPYDHWRGSSGRTIRMKYRHTQSQIQGVKEGGDAVRTYTITRLFMDESEFQPHAHEAMRAAKPLMEPDKDVQIVVVSSSDGPAGVIAELCRDVGFTRFA